MPQTLYIVLRVQHAVMFTIFQVDFFFSFSQQSLNSLKMAASIFETAKSWEGFVQGGKDLSGLLTYELKHLHFSPSWFKTSCLHHEVIIFIQNSVCLIAPILSALHLQSVAQGQVNAYCMTDLHAINFVVWRKLLQFLCWFTIFLIDVNVANKQMKDCEHYCKVLVFFAQRFVLEHCLYYTKDTTWKGLGDENKHCL